MRNLYLIMASIHFLLTPGSVHGWPQILCSKDAECSTPNSYCLDGYCEHCIPCQNFGRQQPFGPGSCAKKEGDCGPCIAGHEAKENTEMRLAFRCEKLGEFTAAPPQPLISLENSTLIPLIAIFILTLVASTVTLYFKRRKLPALLEPSHPTLENPNEEMESRIHEPASNPNRQDEDEQRQDLLPRSMVNEERPREHVNHVEAQPTFPTSSGLYADTIINLSDHRPPVETNQAELLPIPHSATFPTSDDVAYSIDEDPDDTQDGSGNSTGERHFVEAVFSFFVFIKRVILTPARRANNTSAIEVPDN